MLKKYSDVTTIHGVTEVMDTETSLLLRFMWTLIFLTSVVIAVYQLAVNTEAYLRHDTVSTISTGVLEKQALNAICTEISLANSPSTLLSKDALQMVSPHFINTEKGFYYDGPIENIDRTYDEIKAKIKNEKSLVQIFADVIQLNVSVVPKCKKCKPPKKSEVDDLSGYRKLPVSTALIDGDRLCFLAYPGSYASDITLENPEVTITVRMTENTNQPSFYDYGQASSDETKSNDATNDADKSSDDKSGTGDEESPDNDQKKAKCPTSKDDGRKFRLHLEPSVHSVNGKIPVLEFKMGKGYHLIVSSTRRKRLSTRRFTCTTTPLVGAACSIQCRNLAMEKCKGPCRFFDFSSKQMQINYCSYFYDPISEIINLTDSGDIVKVKIPAKDFGSASDIDCYTMEAKSCISSHCLPPCDQWEYGASVVDYIALEEEGTVDCPNTTAELQLRYRDPFAVTYIEENYQYTFPSFIANVGGLLGLYCGISILSLAQVVHFWLFKPFDTQCSKWMKKVKKKVDAEQRKD